MMKNGDVIMKTCDLIMKNGDFIMQNGDFIIKHCDFSGFFSEHTWKLKNPKRLMKN